ncbi:hypothetical protein B0J18DRAFT_365170 [Chaetomium sp. MPI-SDFR-AT-0129]|nr:hypothetical protein B0J18DRAFT_365170 [Chaetomium sp. MPI-SDFR-AT-0129]
MSSEVESTLVSPAPKGVGSKRLPHIVILGHQDVEEIEAALRSFNDRGLDANTVTRDTFSLPTIQAQLARASQDIHHGCGVAIIRGLDPAKYTAEDNVTVFLGISSHIGELRGVQDKKGSMLTHVTASKVWTTPPAMRHGIHTTTGLAWHCDMGAEILALHVRSQAQTGGDTFVASSWDVYKELLESYPDALAALCDPSWPIQVSGDPPRHIVAPLLHVYEDDKILVSVDPGRLGLHPTTAKAGIESDIPALSPLQLESLDILSSLASKHKSHLDLKAGDMVFINNLGLLHARDSYVDPEAGPGRHLVRLWLRSPKLAWSIPKSMRVPWEAAYGPDGNGFPELKKQYQVKPSALYEPPKYTAGSAAFMLEDNQDVNASGFS